MSLQRNYYEVLGIPPGATTDQIKKKYRELARKFHPDVVQDKVLGQRVFSQINQAYRILADPERREQYNSQLAAASAPPARVAQPAPTWPTSPVQQAAPPKPQTASQPRPQATSQPKTMPAGSQTTRPQPAAMPQTRPAAPQTQPGSAQKAHAMTGLLANADNAIMAGKPLEARAFCIKVLEIDPKNVRALEILGDALVGMGRPEDAAVQYRNALAISPSSMIQSKLNRLEQAATATRTNPPAGDADKPGDKASGLFGRFMGRK